MAPDDYCEEFSEELTTMCNLSEGIYERGVANGLKQGLAQGMQNIMQLISKMLDANESAASIKRLSEDEAFLHEMQEKYLN